MHLLDMTLKHPAANLALDEALLVTAERSGTPREVLRIWESPTHFVVLGRASAIAREAKLEECRRRDVPVLRRRSGGAAVVCGPGCLMYAAVLSLHQRPALRMIEQAHRYALERIRQAVLPWAPAVQLSGTSDLSVKGLKVSGNSLRISRDHLLYHGTLLYDFDLKLIEDCLGMPPRQPDYRQQRTHAQFVANLPVSGPELRESLIAAWEARDLLSVWPSELTEQLCVERYRRKEWTLGPLSPSGGEG